VIPGSTVVVVGRTPEKMQGATAVFEAGGFTVIGVFSEAEALRAIAEQKGLLAVVAGGSVSSAACRRLRSAAAPGGAVIIDAFTGRSDPDGHFTAVVLAQLVALSSARRAGDGRGR
jgi:threonine dehydrogenase-like Zn-dependent dehydrogenase